MFGVSLKNKNKDRVLLIGGTGSLGSAIINSKLFKNLSCPLKKNLNLLNRKQIKFYLNKNFSTIINCSGYPRVRECEKNKYKSFKLNVVTTKNLVKEIILFNKKNNKKIKLIHISTDGVYASTTGNYKETDKCKPNTYYGQCKLEAEKIVKRLNNFLIIRTRFFDKNKFKYKDAAVDIFSSMLEVSKLIKIIHILYKKNTSGIINIGKKRESDFKNFQRFFKKIKKTKRIFIQAKSDVFITKDASLNLGKMKSILKND